MIFLIFLIKVGYSKDFTAQDCSLLVLAENCVSNAQCEWREKECIIREECSQLTSSELCNKNLSCVYQNGSCQQFIDCAKYKGSKEYCEKISASCTSLDGEICVETIAFSSCTVENTDCNMENDTINLLVFGKTGVGKSYFLNLLIKEKPKNGSFIVFDQLASGTPRCQVLEGRTVTYGKKNQKLTLNLIDTPGLFDTNDDHSKEYYNDTKPQSILHLSNIDVTAIESPFYNKFNRILILFSADQRFDVQHQVILEISNAMMGGELRFSVIITKCQLRYDKENDEMPEIMATLEKVVADWRKKLKEFQIEEVFFFGNKPIIDYQDKEDEESNFYYQQWIKFYETLQNSVKKERKKWENLTIEQQNKIGKHFNYKIGKSQEQIETENKQREEYYQKMIAEADERQKKQLEKEREYARKMSDDGCVSLDIAISGINNNRILLHETIFSHQMSIKGRKEGNRVLGLIHYSQSKLSKFIKLVFGYQSVQGFVELTGDHLIYCSNRQLFIRADQVTLNDTLLYEVNDYQVNVRIIEISLIIKAGYYSPLTTTGEFFGNGILLSSYASPTRFQVSQEVAHLAMKPLILYRFITMSAQDDNYKLMKENPIQQQMFPQEEYQAYYSKILEWIFIPNEIVII